MTFKQWLLDLFKDERKSTSVKPVIAIIGALFLCGTLLMSSLSRGGFSISSELVDAVMFITIVGMGADTFDKFSIKKTNNTNNSNGEGNTNN